MHMAMSDISMQVGVDELTFSCHVGMCMRTSPGVTQKDVIQRYRMSNAHVLTTLNSRWTWKPIGDMFEVCIYAHIR